MTAPPAPESVRRLATGIEKALSILQRSLRDFEEDQYEAEDPCTQSQRDRLAARVRGPFLTEAERQKVRQLLERGLTYGAARTLLERLDERIEGRTRPREPTETPETE